MHPHPYFRNQAIRCLQWYFHRKKPDCLPEQKPEVVEPALAGPEVGVLAGLAVAELAGLADDVEAETGRAALHCWQ